MLAVIGIIATIVFMSYSIYKGLNPIISAIIGAFIIIFSNGMPVLSTWSTGMDTVKTVMGVLAPLFVFGGIMGIMYSESGAAVSLGKVIMIPARKIKNPVIRRMAVLFLFMILRILIGLAGIDNNAIMLTVMALAVSVFFEFDMPTKYIPAVAIIASTVANLIPGAPTMLNIMLAQFMPGFTVGGAMVVRSLLLLVYVIGVVLLLSRLIERDMKKGMKFEQGVLTIPDYENTKSPHWILSLVPIAVVFVCYNFLGVESWVSLMFGAIVSLGIFGPFIPKEEGKSKIASILHCCDKGIFIVPLILMMVILPSSIMAVAPGLTTIVNGLNSLPIPPALVFMLVATILVGFGGSAATVSVASIAVATFIPTGLTGLACGVIIIWSCMFETLPINSAIMIQCNMVGTTMKEAYPSIFQTTVVLMFIMAMVASLLAVLGVY